MKEIKLFDYQEDMKERIEKALRLHRSVMAQMPTGTGKTYLLTAVIDSFVRANPIEKVWIVAHRRELVSQIDETVRKFHSYSASNTSSLLSSVKAMSIQWLMRYYDEIEEEPGMIVIDEAHHALAKTYKEMWERFPKAKFLGLTATPCRLNGKGFTDLFDVLVQSWGVPEFISKGRLATYDFVSIKSDGVTQRLIDSLQKRGADGDYQNKEMDMLLNKKPSIERLYRSLEEYGKDRKGIVYAINISHAQKIAKLYQEDMVKRVQEAFRHHDSVMVQMPTGTGKTYLLAALVGLFLKEEVWVVAHRRELVSQIKDTLERFFSSLKSTSIKVTSIQWLSRHYGEMEEKPGLIVIDEAHHALAETYAEVMNAYPKAKKLGLTATPYRLNGKGFTDLFDTLLCSWSMEKFIAEGRLSLYDYYSIKPDSAAQLLIDSLQKRGADGDYQQKELNEVMDVKPSLERLCLTIKEYVPGKKGIVYAISIQHAEHIAEYYRENGIKAVAISSKTPLAERQKLIERFKSSSLSSSLNSTSDDIEVLVSVDLFSEGFDCPDVEFIQLARPTLSLAKYMQMVGRGLRVAEGKEFCVILDNVGLYKRFGLPSVDRDWQSMFEGRTSLEDILQEACMQVYNHNCRMDLMMDGDEEMMKIINHERQQQLIMDTYGYQIVEDEKGLKGIKDKDGKMILECQYKKIEVTNDGFAYCYIRKKVGRKEWIDLQNRLWFANKPQSVKLMGIDFSTEDGKKLYPRILSKYIDEKTYLTVKTLELQVGTGLSWKHRFIPWDEPNKVYLYKEGEGNSRLYVDENEQYYVQKNIGSLLEKVDSREELAEFALKDKEEREESLEKLKNSYKHYEYYPVDNLYPIKKYLGTAKDKITIEKDGIWHVEDAQVNESYWVDPITHRKHYTRPVLFKRGYLNILKEGDWCYVRNIPGLRDRPLRQWEIVADDNICVINNKYLIEKSETDQWYKICRRTDDFSYFSVLACFYESEYIKDDTEIQITQFDGEGLKMTQEGFPYTPLVIKTHKRSRWL